MKLFDDFLRTHDGLANHMEDSFSFLNRSARPASERVRSVLEDWYVRFPNQHKLELARKFRADFSVGFFELLMHEVLLCTHYEVEVHPAVPSSQGTHPDFRAKDAVGNVLFLEAAIVTDESEEEKAKNRVRSTLYDQISQLNLSDYFLDINSIHNPTGKQPSGKKLREFISKRVQNLDYDALSVLTIHDLPRWTYTEDDLEVDFGVIPVSRENRGQPNHRPIGIYPGGTRYGGSDAAIRSKIAKKAGKYGPLNSPYIIAVNCLSGWGTHRRDEIHALFGAEDPQFSNSPSELKLIGKLDGAWYGPKGARNKRVSGVILTRVFPWNLPKADITLYHNPWAVYPYQGRLTTFPQVVVADGKLHSLQGVSCGSVFSLPDDWPGELFEN